MRCGGNWCVEAKARSNRVMHRRWPRSSSGPTGWPVNKIEMVTRAIRLNESRAMSRIQIRRLSLPLRCSRDKPGTPSVRRFCGSCGSCPGEAVDSDSLWTTRNAIHLPFDVRRSSAITSFIIHYLGWQAARGFGLVLGHLSEMPTLRPSDEDGVLGGNPWLVGFRAAPGPQKRGPRAPRFFYG